MKTKSKKRDICDETAYCIESISCPKLEKNEDDSGYYIIAGELFTKKQVHDFFKKQNVKKTFEKNVDIIELPSKSKLLFRKNNKLPNNSKFKYENNKLPNNSKFFKYENNNELPNKSQLQSLDYELPSKSKFFNDDEDQYYNFDLPNTSKKINFNR
jgi:hypothetical protein